MFTVCFALVLLEGCSGWDVDLSDARTQHFRTLASVSYFDQDTEKQDLAFDVRKRNRSIMAEKTLFENNNFNASLTAGRHRDHRWMTGITLGYSF